MADLTNLGQSDAQQTILPAQIHETPLIRPSSFMYHSDSTDTIGLLELRAAIFSRNTTKVDTTAASFAKLIHEQQEYALHMQIEYNQRYQEMRYIV